MEKIIWFGLPVKTWLFVLIPTIFFGLLPYITAEIINLRDDNHE
ncbi:MAG: hypothetical protein ACOC1O_06125 [bacterium]